MPNAEAFPYVGAFQVLLDQVAELPRVVLDQPPPDLRVGPGGVAGVSKPLPDLVEVTSRSQFGVEIGVGRREPASQVGVDEMGAGQHHDRGLEEAGMAVTTR